MALIVEYHEELEGDLLPDHDLLDLWRGRMSFRRLELLIRRLPVTSATVRAIAPDAAIGADWTSATEVAAAHFDAYMRVHFKNPPPFPRPAEQIRQRRNAEARHAALERQAQRVNDNRKGR